MFPYALVQFTNHGEIWNRVIHASLPQLTSQRNTDLRLHLPKKKLRIFWTSLFNNKKHKCNKIKDYM